MFRSQTATQNRNISEILKGKVSSFGTILATLLRPSIKPSLIQLRTSILYYIILHIM